MRTDQTIKKRYTVTAGVSTYNALFPLYEVGDVAVYLSKDGGKTETLLTYSTHYTVAIASDNQSGTVTLKAAAGASEGDILALVSNLAYTQELDLSNVSTINTESTETQLDRTVQMIQQLKEVADRSVAVPVTDNTTSAEQLRETILLGKAEAEKLLESQDAIDRLYLSADNIDTVVENADSIDTVAGSIANVDAVGESISNVNTVADSIADVSTVSDNVHAVNVCFDNIEDISKISLIIEGVVPVLNGGTGVTTVDDIQAGKDADGNTITSTYAKDADVVKLSGDQEIGGEKTFTGIIQKDTTAESPIIQTETDAGALRMWGGATSGKGGYLVLCGKDYSANPGEFYLAARDASNSVSLHGEPDGTLTWDGKGFVYTSGDQTIAGTKTFSAEVPIKLTATDAHIRKELNGQPSSQRSIYQGIYDTTAPGYKSFTSWWWTSTNTSCQHGIVNIYGTSGWVYYALRTHSDENVYLEPVNSSIWLGRNTSGYKWEGIYLNASAINTSDERLKENITTIPDAVLDAWGDVQWRQYQFKASIAEKGTDKARLHTGAIAQRIDDVFKAHGLDASRYGLWCYDHWDAEPEEVDSEGNIVTPAREAEDAYALRYEEALCMEAAYQRRRADRAEARIASLERRLDEMEAVLATLGGDA